MIQTYIVALFVMISYIVGQEKLYCSHETLYLSVLEPSTFTQISGMYIICNNYYIRSYICIYATIAYYIFYHVLFVF